MTPELTGVQHQRNKENLNIPIQRNKKLSKKSFYFLGFLPKALVGLEPTTPCYGFTPMSNANQLINQLPFRLKGTL